MSRLPIVDPQALIVVEGPDGCGKTTISTVLRDALQAKTLRLWTRVADPSSGPVGQVIRNFLLAGGSSDLQALGYLFFADRIHELPRWWLPCVVADRYLLSTWVYQAGVMPDDILLAAIGDIRLRAPDVVVLLDVDEPTCIARSASRRGTPECFDGAAAIVRNRARYLEAWQTGGIGGRCLTDPRLRQSVYGDHQIHIRPRADADPHAVVQHILEKLDQLESKSPALAAALAPELPIA